MRKVIAKTVETLRRILQPVVKVMYYISGAVLFLMPIPVILDVVFRFTISKSVPGAIEIEEFLLCLTIFFALAFVQWKGDHVKIDLFTKRFPQWVQDLLEVGMYSAATIFFALMSMSLFHEGTKRIASNEISFSLNIPIGPFRYLAAVGVAVLTLAVLATLLEAIVRVLDAKRTAWLVLPLTLGCGFVLLPALGYFPEDLEGAQAGLTGMGLLFTLIFLGMPIGFGMAIVGFAGMTVIYGGAGPALGMIGIVSYSQAASYMFTVVPMFILMGQFAYHSGISADLFRTGQVWLGRLPGGLAMSSVGGCAGFSAVCGDSLATAVTMGTVALPSMKENKYDMSLATGSLAAGGTLGILIPPSAAFIFYAIVTEESIGELFLAGILPGIMLTTIFMIAIYIRALINPRLAPPGPKTTFVEKLISLKGVIGMLSIFLLIMGGILSGTFSPVEGGAVGVAGASTYAALKGRLTLEVIKRSVFETLFITCKLIMILIGVGILGYFLAATQLPFTIAEYFAGLAINRYLVFAGIIGMLIGLGCVLNVIPMILLVLPTIFPTVTTLGFDPIWFGVVCVLVMEMGQITPPIGVNVFAIHSVAKDVPMEKIFAGIVPFFIGMIICVAILVAFPQIALFLPSLLF
ncbi:MAG: TRAP transporter large permease subunit [Deltaproteobacteria bacterium]|nr:TRAP transporter large permease subunit [Deltaproteobacteria bacterium]